MKGEIETNIQKSVKNIEDLVLLSQKIQDTIDLIIKCITNGNKLIFFGNGGSAADAQHLAAEFINKFKIERESIPAISLTTDSSVITSISNDYSFDCVFSRQCESLVSSGDLVFGISTSGNSKNVELGLKKSKENGAITIGLLGGSGGTIKQFTDISLIVNSTDVARIQEAHRVITHIICESVELEISRIDHK
jgi:D-sedoheptulose 7-phosphate isomerase